MTSHKKTLSFWFLFGCMISLGLSTFLWNNLTLSLVGGTTNLPLKPAAQSDSIPLPVYSVGDYWIYNYSEIWSNFEQTEIYWENYGLTYVNITAIEQIDDQEGNARMCYVKKSVTKTSLYGPYWVPFEMLEYLDTQTFDCVKFDIYYESLNCSGFTQSTPNLFPLEPNKNGSTTHRYNCTYNELEYTEYFSMTAFSNFSTGLGLFSGIRLNIDLWDAFNIQYYSQDIGSFVLETYNTTHYYPDSPTFLVRRLELIEYHYVLIPSKFQISGSPQIFIWIAGITTVLLYIFLKRRQKRMLYNNLLM